MARALIRAGQLLDGQARTLEAQVAGRRKARPGDDSEVVARTLRATARQLRGWAARCWP